MDLLTISTVLIWVITIGVVVHILLDHQDRREHAIGWILTIVLLPIVGIGFYLFLGINWRGRKLLTHSFKEPPKTQKANYKQANWLPWEKEFDKQISLVWRSTAIPPSSDNQCDIFYSGAPFFRSILSDLRNAKHSIDMEYFIWYSDGLGEAIKTILIQQARRGVKVRLIFDGWGALGRISRNYRKELTQNGIRFCYFLDLRKGPLTKLKINYRNHRKITCIDRKIAYLGGMNISMRYITGRPKSHAWRDTSLRLTGSVVNFLQELFHVDWLNSGGDPSYGKNLPITTSVAPTIGEIGIPMQVVVSGPDSRWKVIEDLFLSMITSARRSIHIQTPYFAPSPALLQAMEIAARSGISLNLMVGYVSDITAAKWTAQSYYRSLLEAGVRIFRYRAGTLHAKSIVVDEKMATVGTCNVDMRSCSLNYEANLILYSRKIASGLTSQFQKDLTLSQPITMGEVMSISFAKHLRNSFFRLLAPLV